MKQLPGSIHKVARLARAHWAAAQLVRDPSKLDKVFELDAFLPDQRAHYEDILRTMLRDPEVARAIADRPRVHVDLPTLRRMAPGTFGRATAEFMDARGLDPRSLPELASPGDVEWTQAHLYETHDLWHVVTGFDTDIPGEVGLQAFYLAQLPAKLAQLLIVGGFIHAIYKDPGDYKPRLSAVARGWQLGLAARPLFGVRWGALWSLPLEEVRARLGVTAPAAPGASSAPSAAA